MVAEVRDSRMFPPTITVAKTHFKRISYQERHTLVKGYGYTGAPKEKKQEDRKAAI